MIEVAGLPHRTSTARQAIQGKRARRFHPACDVWKVSCAQLEHPVDVIRHDDPCV